MNKLLTDYINDNYKRLYELKVLPYTKNKVNNNSITIEDLFQDHMIKLYMLLIDCNSIDEIEYTIDKRIRQIRLSRRLRHMIHLYSEDIVVEQIIEYNEDNNNLLDRLKINVK